MQMRRQVINSIYGKLKLEQLVGRGSYGQIYKASSVNKLSSTHNLAVKVIVSDQDPDSLPNIEKQIKILMSCQHQNIVKCYSVQIVEDSVWIVMQYCELGSLADVMKARKKNFNQNQIRSYLKGILKALVYLHDNHIMHRDIKAANVLLMADEQVKVADFGVSTLISQTKMGRNTRTGSPFWMSPQLLSKSEYTSKTDIWSLGITAIQLSEGTPPYSHQHPYRAIFSIQSRPPQSLTNPDKWSKQFNDFVSLCLTLNDNKRPSARQLLAHSFIESQPHIQTKSSFFTKSTAFQQYHQSVKKFRSDYQQEQYECENFGTVIIKDDIDEIQNNVYSNLWSEQPENKNNNYYIAQQEVEKQLGGTFIIKKGRQNMKINTRVLQTISNNSQIQPPDSIQHQLHSQKSENKIENLYLQMETQIAKIRMRYLREIKRIEESYSPTFQSSLQSQKNKIRGFNKNKQNIQ